MLERAPFSDADDGDAAGGKEESDHGNFLFSRLRWSRWPRRGGKALLMQVGTTGEWEGWVVSPLVALAQLTPPKSTTAPRKRVSCVFHCASALRGGLGAPPTFKTALAFRSSSRIASKVFAFEGDRKLPAGAGEEHGEAGSELDRALGGPSGLNSARARLRRGERSERQGE